MLSTKDFSVDQQDEGLRLDIYLARILSDKYSRSQIKKLIEDEEVKVNGKATSAHYRVKPNDHIELEIHERRADETRAEDIPIKILHEDEDIIVVDKPAGMVVHPAYGNLRHTLVNALLFHAKGLSTLNGKVRPGIVHRLDKDTSGIMVVAKHDQAHAWVAKQFKNQTVERKYRVAVRGIMQHDEGVCEEPIGRAFLNRKKVIVKPSGGKEATTYFTVLERYRNASLLEVRPHTGRTHQIRVHMRCLGHPVLGDGLYGVASPGISRQAVHAYSLGFTHPGSKEKVSYQADLPHDFKELIDYLKAH